VGRRFARYRNNGSGFEEGPWIVTICFIRSIGCIVLKRSKNWKWKSKGKRRKLPTAPIMIIVVRIDLLSPLVKILQAEGNSIAGIGFDLLRENWKWKGTGDKKLIFGTI